MNFLKKTKDWIVKQATSLKNAVMAVVVGSTALSSNVTYAAVDAGSIVTKLEQNFTTAETVGIAIVGGFAVLFVFKLIQRML